MAAIIVETQPAVEPVSLAEVKLQLGIGPLQDSDHVTSAMETERLRSLITAAREYAEAFTRRSFVQKGYVQYLDSFPYFTDTIMSQQAYPPAYYSLPRYSTTLWNYSQMIKLFYSPLVSVDHITYIDSVTGRPKGLYLGYAPWFPRTTYVLGAKITDSNGNTQTVTTAGTTGDTEPSPWPTVLNATTNDGTVVWTTGAVAPVSQYIIDTASEPPRLFPVQGQYWPAVLYVPNAVQIHFTAGYSADASLVPKAVKVAIKMLCAYLYKNPSEQKPNFTMDESLASRAGCASLLWQARVLDIAPTRG